MSEYLPPDDRELLNRKMHRYLDWIEVGKPSTPPISAEKRREIKFMFKQSLGIDLDIWAVPAGRGGPRCPGLPPAHREPPRTRPRQVMMEFEN